MISRYFQSLWQELNDFLSSTSVHGLPYIHRSQSGTTRVIWTVLVAGALITATVLLVQTVGDWGTNYISTTIETRGVEQYPFPAVTFYPGEFSSKTGFLRTLLNHFQLTRYEESSPLYDNAVFANKYSTFVESLGPGTTSLFSWVPYYLNGPYIHIWFISFWTQKKLFSMRTPHPNHISNRVNKCKYNWSPHYCYG